MSRAQAAKARALFLPEPMSPACRGTPPRRLYVAAGVPVYVAETTHDAVRLAD